MKATSLTLTAIIAVSLLAAGCTATEPAPPPISPPPSAAEAFAVPSTFEPIPAWSGVQIPADAAVAMDNTRLAYATLEGNEVVVTLLDLTTGQPMWPAPARFPAISEVAPEVRFDGSHVAVFQTDATSGQTKFQVAAIDAEKGNLVSPPTATIMPPGHAAAVTGNYSMVIQVGLEGMRQPDDAWMLDRSGTLVSGKGDTTKVLCSTGEMCPAPTYALENVPDGLVFVYQEDNGADDNPQPTCSIGGGNETPCARGVVTRKWKSPKIAPEGVEQGNAVVEATSDSTLVLSWRTAENQIRYSSVDIASAQSSQAVEGCSATRSAGTPQALVKSPTWEFAVSSQQGVGGNIFVDVPQNVVSCTPGSYSAVQDSGTAWGSSTPNALTREVQEAVLTLGRGKTLTVEDAFVYAPQIINLNGQGIFLVNEGDGPLTLAAFPQK